MPTILTTFQAVATLLFIGVVGFGILSRRTLPAEALRSLSTLALNVSLPALVFVTILRNFDPQARPDWWHMPLLWLGFTLGALALSVAGARLARREHRREMAFTLFYQNATFFPLVILVEIYGADAPILVDLFLFNIFFGAMLFNTYAFFFQGRPMRFPWARTINAMFVSTIAALAICFLGWQGHVPEFASDALSMVGAMATPLLMLIFGGSIYLDWQDKGPLYLAETAKFVCLKNFAFPAVALGVIALARPPWPVALILLIEAAVPPVSSAPIFVAREDGNRQLCAQFVFASFLASLVSIPLAMWALEAPYAIPAP